MKRVVLDTNIVVSALLIPSGIQAAILLLALRGDFSLYLSTPVLAEYEEVLHRPRLKLQPRLAEAALNGIREVAHFVEPTQPLSISIHEADNRFLECAEAAAADYLVTGNAKHFPKQHGKTKIVSGRQFLDAIE